MIALSEAVHKIREDVTEVIVTDNAVEGWHNSFNRRVGTHHANIWKLIEVIKNDDDVSRVNLVKVLKGNLPISVNPSSRE